MRQRIFWNTFLSSLLAAILMGGAVLLILYARFEERIFDELASACRYVEIGLERASDPDAYLKALSASNRVTLVAADGTVLFDSASDASKLENHADRPEIAKALASGVGTSARYSDTQLARILYYARRLPDGRVLRVSTTQKSVLGMLTGLLPAALLILLALTLLSVLYSRLTAARIVYPINTLDLDHPLGNAAYDELAPLLTRMERQRREIAERLAALSEKQRDFAAVTENMREGLLLLDASDRMMTVNGSAAQTFGAQPQSVVGEHILTLERSAALQHALESARVGGTGEAILHRNARVYQVHASAVTNGAARAGTVVLILDVTEKTAAEQSRREFTANVSHELKTPLTSISGYAEIMRDGVAKSGDVARFAGKICEEAAHLLSLIDDIIRLSQLDEQSSLPEMERVDLKAVCEDACALLRPQAAKAGIALTVRCEDAAVRGIAKVLGEMVQNLVDNAIKYNRPGGSVDVSLTRADDDDIVTLCVADTGIGIPEEHQARVFERFYRVERSRSKQIGGTGLGLSIVKHGAELHGARLRLESHPGQGTCVTLTFPAAARDVP